MRRQLILVLCVLALFANAFALMVAFEIAIHDADMRPYMVYMFIAVVLSSCCVFVLRRMVLREDVARHDLRLKKGGPAIDAGANELAPDRDILGTKRPQGTAVDVGAYERVEE